MCPKWKNKSWNHVGNKEVIRKTEISSVKINDSDSGYNQVFIKNTEHTFLRVILLSEKRGSTITAYSFCKLIYYTCIPS
jgi:hypothetical protein